ncbi:pyruvate dehydrogenase (acetyl-transferring) E1 component subunit alpha [Streptomyces sp. NPDC020898]|uniref:pyruvate dehydrogenase (acetyl-transferring) E1 component subunit alpha n=1 Tax=Streptomyces sp. NPDC020898 TaxID=3365101 RepID=UPI0037AEDA24
MTVESTAARKPRRSAGSKTGTSRTTAKTTDAPAADAQATAARPDTAATTKAPAAKRATTKRAATKKPAAKPAGTARTAGTTVRTTGTGADPDLVQLLTPEGKRVKNADYDHYVAALTPDDLRGLYRDMVLTRRFDAEATSLQRQGELGLWASLLGQEAAQIGSGRATRPDDYVFPTYREHGVAWCRDIDPTNLLGMFRGVNNGGWDPNSNNFHLYTIVIGSQTLHATGYAMGVAKDGADSAVIAYFGDGASSQGDVAESFTFASVYNAPVVFFCQNNQWAISEPTERQTRVPLYQRAQGYGFPGVRVDGNDVLAVLAVTKWALERARSGEGPTLVEAYTYRMGAHTTSDDPTRYRHDDERAAWEAKDPIARLRTYLESSNHADEGFFAELEVESEALGRRVREAVRAMPDPDPFAIFEHTYADGHALVDEERAQFAAYQASFADGEGA